MSGHAQHQGRNGHGVHSLSLLITPVSSLLWRVRISAVKKGPSALFAAMMSKAAVTRALYGIQIFSPMVVVLWKVSVYTHICIYFKMPGAFKTASAMKLVWIKSCTANSRPFSQKTCSVTCHRSKSTGVYNNSNNGSFSYTVAVSGYMELCMPARYRIVMTHWEHLNRTETSVMLLVTPVPFLLGASKKGLCSERRPSTFTFSIPPFSSVPCYWTAPYKL